MDLRPKWALNRLRMDDVSIADVQGPEERRLRTISRDRTRDQQEAPTADLASLFAGLKNAEDLYNEGRFAEAEQAYQVVREQATPRRGFRR